MRLPRTPSFSRPTQLIGAYFMHEYSFEASALFNPEHCRAIPIRPARRKVAAASF